MSFAYPFVFVIGGGILLLRLVRRVQINGALFPAGEILTKVPVSLRQRLRAPVLNLLSLAFIVFLTIAAARPQQITLLEDQVKARSIMLALDLSGSMRTKDFSMGLRSITRLEAVRAVVSDFISARKHDRLGLVIFGSKAFLECPITFDHEILMEFVQDLEIGLAGDGTALGDGLGLAIKRIEGIPAESRAVVLVTDGVNTAGQVNPLQAAEVAASLGVKIHTIGIGSPETAERMASGLIPQDLSRYEFDEVTLRKIAEITGGKYFQAQSFKSLQEVYREIDRLEGSAQPESRRQLVQELFTQYAAMAALAYALYLIFVHSVFMRVP